jgi:hypothetical protein
MIVCTGALPRHSLRRETSNAGLGQLDLDCNGHLASVQFLLVQAVPQVQVKTPHVTRQKHMPDFLSRFFLSLSIYLSWQQLAYYTTQPHGGNLIYLVTQQQVSHPQRRI